MGTGQERGGNEWRGTAESQVRSLMVDSQTVLGNLGMANITLREYDASFKAFGGELLLSARDQK